MIIGIDGTPLTIPFHCGLRHYLEELLKSLANIDKKNEYLIFVTKNVHIPKQKNFTLKLAPSKLPIFKRQLFLTLSARKENVDIFHYPDSWGSIFINFPKTVMTFHDLAPSSSYPRWHEDLKYLILRNWNIFVRGIILRKTKAIIAVSNSIRKESVKIAKRSTPVFVIRHGVSKAFEVLKEYDKKNFFLAMTDFSPRKNILRILEAHSLFLKKTDSKIHLKIIISTSYPKKNLLTSLKQLHTDKYVDILEDVSSKTLVRLYNQASCLLYPSLYEGFGLPILEAMASGCPVITSNYGAMKEVAGDAAFLVNPKSVSEISKAMEKIVKNKKLAAGLKLKGLKRAKSFSWEKTARKTLKVYEEVYENG